MLGLHPQYSSLNGEAKNINPHHDHFLLLMLLFVLVGLVELLFFNRRKHHLAV